MPASFQLLASHPALDFVNTLGNRFATAAPVELISGYADLLSFMAASGALEPSSIRALRQKSRSPAAGEAVHRARELREALASMFYGIAGKGAPPSDSIKCLERYVLEAAKQRELVWNRLAGGQEAVPHASWTWKPSESNLDLPVWAIALGAVDLLTSKDVNSVRECSSQTCRWLFLDTSKNHSRRWCDMAICGNRMKARRFLARQQSD